MNNVAREFLGGMRTNKWDGYDKQLGKVDKFNKKYPEFEITQENMDDSIEKREQKIVDTEIWGGMPVSEKFEAYGAQAALNKIKRIEERNREALERQRKAAKGE